MRSPMAFWRVLVVASLSIACNGCSKDSAKPGRESEEKKTSDEPKNSPKQAVVKPSFTLDSGLEYGGTLAVSSDGTILVAQGVGKVKNVQVWDLRKKTLLHHFDVPAAAHTQLALSPDNKTVAYSVEEEFVGPGLVLLRDVATGKQLHELRKRPAAIFVPNLVFSPKGDLLLAAMKTIMKNEIVGWDTKTGKEHFTWNDTIEISSLTDFFDDGKKIASGGADGIVKVWDTNTGKVIASMRGGKDFKLLTVTVSPNGKRLASLNSVGHVEIWDLGNGKVLRAIKPEAESPSAMRFLPDNTTIAFCDSDKNIRLTNTDTGVTTHLLQGHTENVNGLAIKPDGSTLYSLGKDKKIMVWNLMTP